MDWPLPHHLLDESDKELSFVTDTAEPHRGTAVKSGPGTQQHLCPVVGLGPALDIPPAGSWTVIGASPDHGKAKAAVAVFIVAKLPYIACHILHPERATAFGKGRYGSTVS